MIKRKFNKKFLWDRRFGLTPKWIASRVKGYTDSELLGLYEGREDAPALGSGTPRDFQLQAIRRELKIRGLA